MFIGREHALQVLRSRLDAARAGEGSFVLIEGESGVGKTRLTQELERLAKAEAFHVLFGESTEGGQGPYRPWRDVLLRYADRVADAAALAEALGNGMEQVIGILAPELADRFHVSAQPVRANAGTGRRRTSRRDVQASLNGCISRDMFFASVHRLVKHLSSSQPLVLILEDLHDVDEDSLTLLQRLAHQTEGSRVVIVGTRRTETITEPSISKVLWDLRRARSTLRIAVQPFTCEEIKRYVESAIQQPQPFPERALLRIVDLTDGNVQFLVDLLEHLQASWSVQASQSSFADYVMQSETLPLPTSLHELVGNRIGELNADETRVLNVAAVIGREFDLGTLAAIRPALTQVDVALAKLDDRRIIRPAAAGRYRFVHVVYREAIYANLTGIARATYHALVGAALETRYGSDPGPHLSDLAHHHYCAAVDTDTASLNRAVEFNRAAADWTGEQAKAYEQSARLYGQAVKLVERLTPLDDAIRCDLLLAKGTMLNRAGYPSARDEFRTAHDLAARRGWSHRQALAALGIAEGWGRRAGAEYGVFDRSVASLLRNALESLREADWILRVKLSACLAVALGDSLDPADCQERASRSEEAVATASAHNRPGSSPEGCRLEAYALNARHAALWSPDTLAQRLRDADRIIYLARKGLDKRLEMDGHLWRIVDRLEAATVAGVPEDVAAFEMLTEELGLSTFQWWESSRFTTLALLQGRYSDAAISLEKARKIVEATGDLNIAQNTLASTTMLYRETGQLGLIESRIDAFLETHRHTMQERAFAWRAGRALIKYELGHIDQASDEFENLAARDFALPFDSTWLIGMSLVAEVCYLLDQRSFASTLYQRLEPYGDRGTPGGFAAGWWGAVARPLALLATTLREWGTADDWFDRAIQIHRQMNALPWVARTEYERAAMYVARKDADRNDVTNARNLLTSALRTARHLGMTRLQEQIRTLEERLSPPAGLTARELEVLRMMCIGMSSKQIANALSRSSRVVEDHTDHIYKKIEKHQAAQGVYEHTNRVTAVNWAREQHLC